jgi:hypothetical protein
MNKRRTTGGDDPFQDEYDSIEAQIEDLTNVSSLQHQQQQRQALQQPPQEGGTNGTGHRHPMCFLVLCISSMLLTGSICFSCSCPNVTRCWMLT